MLSSIKERRDRDEEGFTLIELMVVVLIIAILLAIAIPTFLGARNGANARAAQSDLRNALTAEDTNWTNNQAFAADLSSLESSLTWVSVAPTAGNIVTAVPGDSNQAVILGAFSKDGNCYYVLQSNDPGTLSSGASASFTGYEQVPQSSSACPVPGAFTSVSSMTYNQSGKASANPQTTSAVGTTWYGSW